MVTSVCSGQSGSERITELLTQEQGLLPSQICKSLVFPTSQLGKLPSHHTGVPSRSSSIWHPSPIRSVGDPWDPHWAQGAFNHCTRLSICLHLGGKHQVMENNSFENTLPVIAGGISRPHARIKKWNFDLLIQKS